MDSIPYQAYAGSVAGPLLALMALGMTPSARAVGAAMGGFAFAPAYQITESDLTQTRTVEEVAAFRGKVKARLAELDNEFAGQLLDPNAQEEFSELRTLGKNAESRELEFRIRREAVMEAAGTPGSLEASGQDLRPRTRVRTNLPDNLHDIAEYRSRTTTQEGMVALMVDGAKKAVEQAWFPHELATDKNTKEYIHRLFETADEPEVLARHILATGSPMYARAFGKMLTGRQNQLTNEERAAIAVVGTTTAGGYAVPYTLDPTLILTSDGAVNPLRQISRVERITGNTWKGLTTAGVSISRGVAEGQPVTPTNITFGQPSVTVQPVKVEIQFSIEADEDWPRLQAEMARVLQDAKDTEEADSFTNGDGTGVNPGGIIATLAGGSVVGAGLNVKLNDVDHLIGELPARFEPRARFMAHRAVFTAISQMDRAAGVTPAYQPLVAGDPPSLRGYPRHNNSAMESDIHATGERVLLFGDFNYFLIVDKVGLTIELDPHVRDGDGKWTGQRAILAHYRNSSVILTSAAFRVLVPGTAS